MSSPALEALERASEDLARALADEDEARLTAALAERERAWARARPALAAGIPEAWRARLARREAQLLALAEQRRDAVQAELETLREARGRLRELVSHEVPARFVSRRA